MEAVRSERATVTFFDGLTVDGYRMPDGEFRVGITSAGVILGFSKEWLGRLMSRGGNAIKTLRGYGFTEKIIQVATKTIRGSRDASTISLRDFNLLIL